MKRASLLSDQPSFKLCQQILHIFAKEGINIPHREIHKFVGKFDRTSIRSEINFRPLQNMVQQLTPKIVNDIFIAKTPIMMGNMTFIYGNLNLHSSLWMNHTSRIMTDWLMKGDPLPLETLYHVYRTFVELDQHSHPSLLSNLRVSIKNKLVEQLKQILQGQVYHSPQFSKQFDLLHKYIRTILLDAQSPPNILDEVFSLLQTIFEAIEKTQTFQVDQRHLFNNPAASYELCKVFNVQLPSGRYQSVLQNVYQWNKSSKSSESKSNADRGRKGESMFQNRFQKSLYINGYQFQGNVKIGLSEYDVVVKGKNRKKFMPFEKISLDELKIGKFREITDEQKSAYQKMTGLWYIGQIKRLEEDLIINLNGPYHYIVGDRSGIVRHEEIKGTILKHYGYSNFCQIDYRQWESKTFNQRAITEFFQSTFHI